MKRKCDADTTSIYAKGLEVYTTELWNNGAPNGDTIVTNTDPATHTVFELRLHRFLLMANSRLFSMMLANDAMAESAKGAVSLHVDTDAWTTAVKFMYTQSLDFGNGAQAKRAIQCLMLADFLLAKSLSGACMHWALTRVSRSNCCSLFAHGAEWRDNGSPLAVPASIVDAAIECIGRCVSYEPDASIFWRGFRFLPQGRLIELLRSERLCVISESALLDAVSTWAQKNDADLRPIVSCLKLHHVPQTVLASLILSPPPHLASIKDTLSSALATSVTGTAASGPRARVSLGMLFAHRTPAGTEMLVGNPAAKVHRIAAPTTLKQSSRLVVSGNLLFSIGGELPSPLHSTSAVDVLDLNSGTITSGPCMRMPLAAFSCAANSERIIVCGGEQENGLVSMYIEALHVETSKWHVMATMNTRRRMCASVICHGRLFVLGGLSPSGLALRSVEVFEMVAPFVMLAGATLPLARHSHAAVAIDAFVYVLGGNDDEDAATSTVMCFDTIALTWTDAPAMLVARSDFSAAAFEGHIYVCGGASIGPECEVYCPESRTWSPLPLGFRPSVALAIGWGS